MKNPSIAKRFSAIVTKRIMDISATLVLLVTILIGGLLLFASYLLGIHSVQIPPDIPGVVQFQQEMGYLYAINWSLNYTIFFPFALYFMLKSLQSVPIALEALSFRKMARDKNYQRVEAGKLADLWRNKIDRLAVTTIPITLAIAISLSFGEWYITNFSPLIVAGSKPISGSIDWGVGVLIHGGKLVSKTDVSVWLRALNSLFDLICFAMQALLIFSILTYFVFMTGFSLLFPQGLKLSEILMIPDIESGDERRGFEEFETMLTEMLFAALFAYILSFLSRLQNAYMHCPREMSLWDFVREDVFTGFFSGSNFGPFTIQTSCENALPLDFPDILVIVCPLLVVLVIIFVVIWTLRSAADAAKKQLQICIKTGDDNLIADKPVEEIEESLEQMQIWPMRYPKFNMLLCLCGFAVISVVFYKIGLVILGVVMWVVIKRVVSEMNR